jgi:Cyclic nucleotide-binding domain
LKHSSGVIRETALFAIAHIEPAGELAGHCRQMLQDPQEEVRKLAQAILEGTGEVQKQGGPKMIVVEKMLFLRQVPLLATMATSELTQVASIAREVTYPAGAKIIQEGERGDNMFLIVDGEVSIQRGGTVLKTLHAKDFFGEMSIIDGEARSASAFAQADCLLLRIDRQDFNDLLTTYNSAAISVIRALIRRLREVLPALERAQRGM